MAGVEDGGRVRARVHVSGLVQGVGFRPFVWREATRRGLSGWVGNDAAGVVLEVEGEADSVAALVAALAVPPPLARVDGLHSRQLPVCGGVGFEVRASDSAGARFALVAPDTTTCDDCLRELASPTDRRFGHPFITCTNCGPRYTIVESVPYDRSRTTMAPFALCPACQAEYADPGDRRFHAEPLCCRRCGPRLRLLDGDGVESPEEPIAGAAALLRAGAVVAVEGVGGFHLAADAGSNAAVTALRRRKQREDRPFAVLVADIPSATELCELGAEELALITSAARPIVILRRRPGARVADAVAPGSPSLGLMLPYTPVHTLLMAAFGGPLVLTSGNASGGPIAYFDADARDRLSDIADAFLLHDRVIRTRVDDSVSTVVRERVVPVRRSRGYVPQPVALPLASPQPILACGSALKNTFCVARGSHAFVSHHIGDLDDYATLQSYLEGVAHLTRLLDVAPSVVAHDLHPDYPSTRYATELPDVRLVGVQHHHAHIASCLADNGVCGPVIGVAFDGVGLGLDGAAWGGEFLIADLSSFTRVAHLAEVPLPGGDAAVHQPWRMALAHLEAAFAGAPPAGLAVRLRQGRRWEQVLAVARTGVNAPSTTSAGRLFDAVSALLGVRDYVTYEGQAAIELENVADRHEAGTYDVGVTTAPVARVELGMLVRALTEDLLRGAPVPTLAARFHNALADSVLTVCQRLREEHGLATVALSGGVFQNSLLLGGCLDRLQAQGFTVLTHRQVPCNDGGLSLGQAAVAAAVLSAEQPGG